MDLAAKEAMNVKALMGFRVYGVGFRVQGFGFRAAIPLAQQFQGAMAMAWLERFMWFENVKFCL